MDFSSTQTLSLKFFTCIICVCRHLEWVPFSSSFTILSIFGPEKRPAAHPLPLRDNSFFWHNYQQVWIFDVISNCKVSLIFTYGCNSRPEEPIIRTATSHLSITSAFERRSRRGRYQGRVLRKNYSFWVLSIYGYTALAGRFPARPDGETRIR